MKIAVAGFQHETNTFASTMADYAEFVKRDAWPGLTQGAAMLTDVAGRNLPVTGFIEAAQERHHQIIPLLWCSAEPSSYVTEDAFERITERLSDSLRTTTNYDAIYLDLHGAMATEHLQDGEGEVLRRVREIVGPEFPLVISLDLHANVTEAMVEYATAMAIFRTYPHVDMADTGRRALDLLTSLQKNKFPAKGMRKLPFLVPLTGQCTNFEPNLAIYSRLQRHIPGIWNIDFAAGFPPADISECGGAVVAYGSDQAAVNDAVTDVYDMIINAEKLFDTELSSPVEAVARALEMDASRPVILADAQDNPGAGASSDTVGVLHALVEGRAQGAVMAIINDPEIAALAHQAGIGGTIKCGLGGKSGQNGQTPYFGEFVVQQLGDGRFVCTGEMYRGAETELGPMALLRVVDDNSDVRVIVGSERFQCLDLAIFRHLNVEPTEQRILVVKSTVHFRADFDSIAAQTLVVESPGANPCRLENLEYKHLRPGIRLGPGGPVSP